MLEVIWPHSARKAFEIPDTVVEHFLDVCEVSGHPRGCEAHAGKKCTCGCSGKNDLIQLPAASPATVPAQHIGWRLFE
eukprot:2275066-Pyramimonas_sp.AAC.1